jgi:hypothetical protein
MDILTMSLGGSDGWTEGTASVVSSRISASGKIVTIAAGNEVCFPPSGEDLEADPWRTGRFRLVVQFGSWKRH